jgi:hypothetical protein
VAASFHVLFGPYPRDFRKDNEVDTKYRESSLEMQDTMKHKFTARRGSNTLTASLVDWLACLGERAQNANKFEITSCKLNIRNGTQTLRDVRFERVDRRHFSAVEAANNQTMVKCWINRTHKNGQKGDENLITRNTSSKCFQPCSVPVSFTGSHTSEVSVISRRHYRSTSLTLPTSHRRNSLQLSKSKRPWAESLHEFTNSTLSETQ